MFQNARPSSTSCANPKTPALHPHPALSLPKEGEGGVASEPLPPERARGQGEGAALLELAFFEGADIRAVQFEPLPICALIGEPPMPIRLDARGIICSDCVNKRRGIWKGHSDLLDAALQLLATPDLMKVTRLDKIDIALAGRRVRSFRLMVRCSNR